MSPRLAAGIRLRHDRARDRWMLLGPERGYVLNATGVAVVQAFARGRTREDVVRDVAGDDPLRITETMAFLEHLLARGLVVE